jgi:hypothetical protein
MLALDRITIGDQQQLKGFLTQQFSPTRPEKCGFFCSVVSNAQLYRKFIYYYSMREKFFFVCVAADSIVACDGLAEERKKNTPALKYTQGWQRDMGNWPKGEIGSNEACALLRERKKKNRQKEKKNKGRCGKF